MDETTTPYGYVYLIENIVNGKMYIGKKASPVVDEHYWGSGKLIRAAIRKYGKSNFTRTILSWHNTQQELEFAEVEEIKQRNAVENKDYYNLIDTPNPVLFGENNGFHGKHHTAETRAKWSKERKNRPLSVAHRNAIVSYSKSPKAREFYDSISKKKSGVLLTEEHKRSIQTAMNRPEVREKISEAQKRFSSTERGRELCRLRTEKSVQKTKGVPIPIDRAIKISRALTGKPHHWNNKINQNPEKIRKTAEKHRGMKRSLESRLRMSNAAIGRLPANAGKKQIHNLETNEVRLIDKNTPIPSGWGNGNGTKVIYSKDTNKRRYIPKHQEIPPGWYVK